MLAWHFGIYEMSMTPKDAIARIEQAFRTRLPEDYRSYLEAGRKLERGVSYEFPLPKKCVLGEIGFVDVLYTAEQILENDAREASGDADAKMLIVGWDLFGGYIYLSFSPDRPGIFYRAPYVSGEYFRVGNSFSDFLSVLTKSKD